MEEYKFDRYKVNQKLYDYVLADLPEGSSPLEEAWHIYKRLCKKLTYSVDYYIEDVLDGGPYSPQKRKLSNLSYIETVDGEKNSEVVCFDFVAIYSYILFDRGLISEEDFRENLSIKYDSFYIDHTEIACRIDDVRLRIDACIGLDMDLNLAKYGNHALRGWKEGFLGNNLEGHAKFQQLMDAEAHEVEEKNARQRLYKGLKISEGSFEKLSLKERVELFFDAIKVAPDYSMAALSYVSETYSNIFSKRDLTAELRFVDSTFILEDNELKEFLFVNPKGYQNKVGCENFDTLQIYEISLKEKRIIPIKREELLRRVFMKESIVFSSNVAKKNGSEMMNVATSLSPSYITIKGSNDGKKN